MRFFDVLVLVGLLSGCISDLKQVAGTGAVYHTRCSADMSAEQGVYRAQCTPDPCAKGFSAGPVSHIVVALDPGRKIVGVAERVCLQDLSRASGLFHPALLEGSDLEDEVQDPAEAP